MARFRGRDQAKKVIGDMADARGMARLSAAFIEWLQVRGYSPNTVREREVCIGWFTLWCEERAITRPTEVTRPIVERYQRWLYHYRKEDGHPLSLRHQHNRLMAVRMFFKWATKQNHTLYNPASEIELPRMEKRLPQHVLSATEAETVINTANTSDPLGLRDRAMMETLYSTGMRRSELIGLHLYDIDVERGTVMIRHGKGGKDRMIPIGDRALSWMDKYIREVRPALVTPPDAGTLFLTNMGDGFTPKRLSQVISGYVEKANLGKRGSCHLFRHTMATLMLENGADIRFIQEMLGHASVETTQIYTQVSIRKLKEIHTATHPARLSRNGTDAAPAGSVDESSQRAELLATLDAEADEELAAARPP